MFVKSKVEGICFLHQKRHIGEDSIILPVHGLLLQTPRPTYLREGRQGRFLLSLSGRLFLFNIRPPLLLYLGLGRHVNMVAPVVSSSTLKVL